MTRNALVLIKSLPPSPSLSSSLSLHASPPHYLTSLVQGPPGNPAVVERFEEGFVCYGIPTADDPSGCKEQRSVGKVKS